MKPRAKRLRDFRDVPLDSATRIACYFMPCSTEAVQETSAFEMSRGSPAGEETWSDPADFDVFRPATGALRETLEGKQVDMTGDVAAAGRMQIRQGKHRRSLCRLCKKQFAMVACQECRRVYCLRWVHSIQTGGHGREKSWDVTPGETVGISHHARRSCALLS